MSDRAASEKLFHHLLEQYRETVLPDVIKNWENMDDSARATLSKLNNL